MATAPRPPQAIAIDVDGTLIVNGQVNAALVSFAHRCSEQGFDLMLWSMRGREVAKQAAEAAGLSSVIDVVASKPGYMIDDRGFDWLRGVRLVRATGDLLP